MAQISVNMGFIGRNGKGKTTFLNLLLGKYPFEGSIVSSTKFDYFPYEIADYQKEMSVTDFMDDLKPGCEMWRVICELEELSENPEKLFQFVHHKKRLINVKGYSLKYRGLDKPVFEELSFEIESGDRVVLSGRNDSGKTTVIRKILQKCNAGIEHIDVEEEGV